MRLRCRAFLPVSARHAPQPDRQRFRAAFFVIARPQARRPSQPIKATARIAPKTAVSAASCRWRRCRRHPQWRLRFRGRRVKSCVPWRLPFSRARPKSDPIAREPLPTACDAWPPNPRRPRCCPCRNGERSCSAIRGVRASLRSRSSSSRCRFHRPSRTASSVQDFPATLAVDDPCVADELSLPTVSWSKTGDVPAATEWDVSAELSKRITNDLGISIGDTWSHIRPPGGRRKPDSPISKPRCSTSCSRTIRTNSPCCSA